MDEYPYSNNDFQFMKNTSNQDFWENDGVSLTGNPNPSSDTVIVGSRVPGGASQDHISLNQYQYTLSTNDNMLNLEKTPIDDGMRPWGHSDLEFLIANKMSEPTNHLWKYNEDKILKDVQDYVTSTYGSHYCGHNEAYKNTQTIDLMAAKDLATGFCQANILKYGSRYGDKDGRNKRDLLKVIHYAMLLLHFDGHYSRKDNGLTEFR